MVPFNFSITEWGSVSHALSKPSLSGKRFSATVFPSTDRCELANCVTLHVYRKVCGTRRKVRLEFQTFLIFRLVYTRMNLHDPHVSITRSVAVYTDKAWSAEACLMLPQDVLHPF